MFTAIITLDSEIEKIRETKSDFGSVEDAANYAINRVKPFVENCHIADGEWKVFENEHPALILWQDKTRSYKSMVAERLRNR